MSIRAWTLSSLDCKISCSASLLIAAKSFSTLSRKDSNVSSLVSFFAGLKKETLSFRLRKTLLTGIKSCGIPSTESLTVLPPTVLALFKNDTKSESTSVSIGSFLKFSLLNNLARKRTVLPDNFI